MILTGLVGGIGQFLNKDMPEIDHGGKLTKLEKWITLNRAGL